MKKKELVAFKEDIERALVSREALGEFDANSKYMIYLLKCLRSVVEHSIETYPKSPKKNPPGAP